MKQRLRKVILEALDEKGPLTSGQVYDEVNSRLRWGASMNAVGSILPTVAVKVGYIARPVRQEVWAIRARLEEEA